MAYIGKILNLTNGGTNASLTASNGGILYSTASAVAILAGTATAGQLLRSGSSTAPTWTTSTYPATNAINTILYASSANVMAALTTANNAILNTSGSGVPSLATSPSISGTYTTTGGNLALPTTTSTAGNITINSVSFIQSFGTKNTFVGASAGNYTTTGSGENTGIGSTALTAISTGVFNTAVGSRCMSSMAGGNSNTAMGLAALNANSAGSQNCAFGEQALEKNTGSSNTAMGYLAIDGAGAASNITAVGFSAAESLTSGGSNTAIGSAALQLVTTGTGNLALGVNAGSNCTGSDSNNIYLLDLGTAGDNGKLKIGIGGVTTTCFIQGISGVTVTGTAVLCSSTGQLGTIASSERYKENIENLSPDISVMHLRPIAFNYKEDPTKTKKYGLLAEDVDKDFPYLCFYNEEDQPESVKYHELCTFLLHEVQKLNKRIERLENAT